MQEHGSVAPKTEAEVKTTAQSVESTAKGVVTEVAKTMGFDDEEFQSRVTEDVIQTAVGVLMGNQLTVFNGSISEFESWRSSHSSFDVEQMGSTEVDFAAWHPSPVAERVIVATYQNHPEAATEMVRRAAFQYIYREMIE